MTETLWPALSEAVERMTETLLRKAKRLSLCWPPLNLTASQTKV